MGRIPIDISGQIFGNLMVLGRDTSARSGTGKHIKWRCKCSLCGNIVSVRSSDLRHGGKMDCGCVSVEKYSNARLVNRVGDVYGHLTVLRRDLSMGYKAGRHARWICRCDLCGCEESVAANMLSEFGKDRCHNCTSKSIGEARIADILDKNDIRYVRDKTYLDCINEKTSYGLRFDFRIIDDENDCLYFIEYDGLQHFRSAPMWDENGDLEERQRRDRLKNEWCRENGFALIRIPYKHLHGICIDDLRLESTRYRVI